jgi:protein-disulfide isomerase
VNRKPFTVHRRRLIEGAAAMGLAVGLPARAATPTPVADDMSLGDPHAKVTVIEYGSASCPHCAHFNNDVFPDFKTRYVDSGRVRYIFREFLTPPVEFAAASFIVARCAGRDKYFSVLDAIFHAQAHIYQTGDAAGGLLKVAKDAGLTEAQMDACLADKGALAALNARVDGYMNRDGVQSTPTFFVNGEKLEGLQTLDELDAAVGRAEALAAQSHRQPAAHRTAAD